MYQKKIGYELKEIVYKKQNDVFQIKFFIKLDKPSKETLAYEILQLANKLETSSWQVTSPVEQENSIFLECSLNNEMDDQPLKQAVLTLKDVQ